MSNTKSTTLIPFQFESHNIRTVKIDGDPWIVAADVTEALEYARFNSNLLLNIPEEWKNTATIKTSGGTQKMLVINTFGFCVFISRSDRPKAKELLKAIVTHVHLSPDSIIDLFADLDVPDPENYFVYAVQEVNTGKIKIGVSKDPERRVISLNTGNSSQLRLINYVPAPNRFKDERIAHSKTPGWIRGEWYSCTEEEALASIGLIENNTACASECQGAAKAVASILVK